MNITYKEFKEKFNINLTVQQEEAVQTVTGPVLLLSVPGSGKTTVLITRIAWMVYGNGIRPEDILVLTYTVSAAGDMKRRFSEKFGKELGGRIHFSTINSICNSIIYWYAKFTGHTVFEFSDYSPRQAGFLKQAYQKITGEFPTESDISEIRTSITFIKNMMLKQGELLSTDTDKDKKTWAIYNTYVNFMHTQHIMDYDDQLVYANTIISSDPRALKHIQDRFKYVLVDEAQDTSKIQHRLISLIARGDGADNLFMVGDEDQSIYGFRGAYPEALMSFTKVHPNAKTLLMEENFRSDASIVKAASNVIRHNTMRHEKKMTASHGAAASAVKNITLAARAAQLTYLARVASDTTEQTAILYRDNESVIPLVDLLDREKIPYRIKRSEMTFFNNMIVKDITDIIKFAYDQGNASLFMNIYYKVRTYLKKQDALTLCGVAQAMNETIFEAAENTSTLKNDRKNMLTKLRKELDAIKKMNGKDMLIHILCSMGYLDYMDRNMIDDSRLYAIRKIADKTKSPEDFLERMQYLKDTIMNKEDDPDVPLILSTIHSSKGLEYDNVYMLDVIDDVFPKLAEPGRSSGSSADRIKKEKETFEEERRIFYVGVTRAKKHLTVFSFKTEDSRFIKELMVQE